MPGKLVPAAGKPPVTVESIERRIYLIRGQKVMIDSDLAVLYKVETSNLNRAVKRNVRRFPEDFMFQLSDEEAEALRFQIGMSKPGARGGRRYLPYAFTELGVAMLSSVLKSDRAVQMNIVIMRAFVKLREVLASQKDLARRLERVEEGLRRHGSVIGLVVDEIKKLKQSPAPAKRRVGFVLDEKR
jgi:hypothetical protein